MREAQALTGPHRTIFLFGIGGGLAQLVAKELLRDPKVRLIGIDSRPVEDTVNDRRFSTVTIRYTRTELERLFSLYQPTEILHLARASQSRVSSGSMKHRLQVNVMGTQHLLDLCQLYGVKHVVILSTAHVYGALSDNPAFIREEAPLRASLDHPQLRDVVQMDQMVSNWLWQYQQQCQTILLRPCSILGPHIKNAMSSFLRSPLGFKPIDYNPMMQFIHEQDMARILIAALQGLLPTGIYNVAAPGYLELSKACDVIAPRKIPLPLLCLLPLGRLLQATGLGPASYLFDYLKYPCLLNIQKLEQALGPTFCWHRDSYGAVASLAVGELVATVPVPPKEENKQIA